MGLSDSIKKFDNFNTGKCLNYPSKSLIQYVILMMSWAFIFTFTICTMFFNRWHGGVASKIAYIVLIIFVGLVFSFIGYRYVYKPIRYYEKTYGKTGLGDKFFNR